MPGEREIIARLRAGARAAAGVSLGIGDDAAVLHVGGTRDLLACSDLMAEGVHFRRDWSPPRLLGQKALAVTLSDIAAMGGAVRYAMVSIALPGTLSPLFIEALFDGLMAYAEQSGVAIIGGDTSSSVDSLFIDTIALGDCHTGRAVRRSGAQAGDLIYVTGALGASIAGLLLLERGHRLTDEADDDEDEMSAVRAAAMLKHLGPAPHLALADHAAQREMRRGPEMFQHGCRARLTHLAFVIGSLICQTMAALQ